MALVFVAAGSPTPSPAPSPAPTTGFRYLNSGGIIGVARPFLRMLRALRGYGSCVMSDQRCFGRYYLENPHLVRLDTGGELFFNLHHVRNSSFTIDGTAAAGGSIASALTGTEPCLVHGNGGNKRLFNEIVRLWGLALQQRRRLRIRV